MFRSHLLGFKCKLSTSFLQPVKRDVSFDNGVINCLASCLYPIYQLTGGSWVCFASSVAIGTRCLLLKNTLSLQRKKLKLHEESWIRMFLLAKKNQSRRFVPSHGGNRYMDMNKFFLGDSRSLRSSLKVTAPNVLVHLSVFIPMAMAIRQLSFGGLEADSETSNYVIPDSSFLWIDSLLTPSLSLSAVLFTIHVINWRVNLIRPTPIRGLKKAKQPPIFLIFPAVQALMGTQLPATLVLYWTMTAVLATVESLTFRLPLNSLRKSLKLQPNSVYLLPSGSRELCEAVANGSYYPGVESAKHTIQNSDILEPAVGDILIKSLERK